MFAVVTSKGRVTIPIEVRRRFGIKAGSKLDFVITEDGRMEVIPMTDSMLNLKGMVPKPKKALALEEMDEAIGERNVDGAFCFVVGKLRRGHNAAGSSRLR